jgi:multicomponent Na+:H+ antiporter subunit C
VSRSRIRGLLALPLLGAFGALLVWALYGLPAFGHYRGPYGNVVNRIVVPERHATNAVGTTVFDIRAVDTMGEELILFAAVVGVVMLLRRTGEDEDHGPEDPVRSVAIRVGGIVGVAVVTLVGICVTHLAYVVAAWICVVGIYGAVTSRNLVQLALCLTVTQSSTYVLLLAIGYRTKLGPPIFKGTKPPAVDPIVQALVLTDIVVSVTVIALILALAIEVHKKGESIDPDELPELKG